MARCFCYEQSVELRLLGPLEVSDDDRAVALGRGKQRSVLALLLLHANQVVSAERLIDGVWRGQRPQSAENTLQTYISRLRKVLGTERILTQAPGYLIRVQSEELDLVTFEGLAGRGRQALDAGKPTLAVDLLRRALGLWRGPALDEFTYDLFAQAEIARLEEARLAAVEDRIDSELALGRHVEVTAELESLIATHPLRERLRGQHMLALYRTGRQGDALNAYRSTHRLLLEELGINPSPPLKQLQTRILVQDPALDLPRSAPQPGPAASLVTARPHPVRKSVTVLAADISPTAALDPEVLARVLRRTRQVITEMLRRYGGFVLEASGEDLLAIFGVPALHEDDADRAARSAVSMHEAVRNLNSVANVEGGGGAVELRIGIDTGEVLASGTDLIEGSPMSHARRLKDSAREGEVLLGNSTHAALAGLASAVAVEEPEAWRLLARAAIGATLPRRFDTPLIGREIELSQLRDAFDSASRKRVCHLFTLLGPAGIGKSRLAHELSASLSARATTLIGRCLPYGEGITFWPLSEIVRQAAGDTTPKAIARLLQGEERQVAIAERVASALGVGEARGDGDETFWAGRKLLESIARTRPLLLVFEDIHWAEPTLLDFIEHLAEVSREAPILALCLARPELLETRRAWSGGKYNAASMLLEGLSRRDADLLIHSLSERLTLSDLDRIRVAEVAEGNPLFIEQMLALADETGNAGELAVPATIQSVLAARLDRLAPDERRVVERACIVGREFSRSAIEDLSVDDERARVGALLEELVRKELIRPHLSHERGEAAFRFRHALIRDTAYESVPKAVRAELHARLADWLDRMAGERASELDEIVGYHLEQAYMYRVELSILSRETDVLAERAADRLSVAGQRAYTGSDAPAATRLLCRAASLKQQGDASRGELLALLAAAYLDRGDWEAAEGHLADAMRIARDTADRQLEVRTRLFQVQHRLHMEPAFTTHELLEQTNALLLLAGELGFKRNQAAAEMTLAWAHLLRGNALGAAAMLSRVMKYATREGDKRLFETALRLQVSAWVCGPTSVERNLRRISGLLGDRAIGLRARASVVRSLALLNAMATRFDVARRLVAEDGKILAELGLELTLAGAREVHGLIELMAGRPDAAEQELRRGLDAATRFNDHVFPAGLATALAQALYAQERYDDAWRCLEIGRRSPIRDIGARVRWYATRAKLLARRDRSSDAVQSAWKGVELAKKTDCRDALGEALLAGSETEIILSNWGRANDFAEAALRVFRRKGNSTLGERARDLAAQSSERAKKSR